MKKTQYKQESQSVIQENIYFGPALNCKKEQNV